MIRSIVIILISTNSPLIALLRSVASLKIVSFSFWETISLLLILPWVRKTTVRRDKFSWQIIFRQEEWKQGGCCERVSTFSCCSWCYSILHVSLVITPFSPPKSLICLFLFHRKSNILVVVIVVQNDTMSPNLT